MSGIEQLDTQLLLAINGARAHWMDVLMVLFSDKYFWIWLYAPVALIIFRKWGWKGGLLCAALLVTAFILTDQVSVHLFKNVIKRPRPCTVPGLMDQLQLLEGFCNSKYGFVSSHAANTACVAIFLLAGKCITWKNARRVEKLLFILLPVYFLGNGYSRIYLGLHYPGDVLAGWLLGAFIGFVFARFFMAVSRKYLPVS